MSFRKADKKQSTPTVSVRTGDAEPTILTNPINSDTSQTDENVEVVPVAVKREARRRGRPYKTELADVRAEALEESLELEPDGDRDPQLDFDDGAQAISTQLRNELCRNVLKKGRARIPGHPQFETKLARLVRKAVNLAMAGDRQMLIMIFERFGGKVALGKPTDKPAKIILQSNIPTPVDE
jgi:hypothetical protein